ncbi:MAG TPA: gas vesicle protein [Candidatus Limnocylindria bacterium]|nr:gas vesicle protein [Candidatus Limnocylindria bacterium]
MSDLRTLGPDDELRVSLVELAHRLLDRGVVLTGHATISVAGVDLIYLGLSVVLSGVEALVEAKERSA